MAKKLGLVFVLVLACFMASVHAGQLLANLLPAQQQRGLEIQHTCISFLSSFLPLPFLLGSSSCFLRKLSHSVCFAFLHVCRNSPNRRHLQRRCNPAQRRGGSHCWLLQGIQEKSHLDRGKGAL